MEEKMKEIVSIRICHCIILEAEGNAGVMGLVYKLRLLLTEEKHVEIRNGIYETSLAYGPPKIK